MNFGPSITIDPVVSKQRKEIRHGIPSPANEEEITLIINRVTTLGRLHFPKQNEFEMKLVVEESMKEYTIPDAALELVPKASMKMSYFLESAVHHLGDSPRSGHYWTDCYNRNSHIHSTHGVTEVVRYDDENVKRIDMLQATGIGAQRSVYICVMKRRF